MIHLKSLMLVYIRTSKLTEKNVDTSYKHNVNVNIFIVNDTSERRVRCKGKQKSDGFLFFCLHLKVDHNGSYENEKVKFFLQYTHMLLNITNPLILNKQ